MYGHLDKQPAMVGWDAGLGPWTPVLRDGKLFGRGGADDGYAIFAADLRDPRGEGSRTRRTRASSSSSNAAKRAARSTCPRTSICSSDKIGTPRLVICLDSGCGNYEQLWMTTSLRGSIVGNLTVEVLTEGVHSGDASGIVPSSFRILRILLDRLEDAQTGRIIPEWLHAEVPPDRIAEARETARILGDEI